MFDYDGTMVDLRGDVVVPSLATQGSLFGHEAPEVDGSMVGIRHIPLSDGAWVDHLQGWVRGHEVLFEDLMERVEWCRHRRAMYDRMVDVPRLLGSLPARGPTADIAPRIQNALAATYGLAFDRVSLALYRDGRDSVAWHGDQVARDLPQAMVVTVSLGEPRRFMLRPKAGGPSMAFELGHGDLVVMGGTCQRTWEHCVPKCARAGPRMALMFRPSSSSSPPTSEISSFLPARRAEKTKFQNEKLGFCHDRPI